MHGLRPRLLPRRARYDHFQSEKLDSGHSSTNERRKILSTVERNVTLSEDETHDEVSWSLSDPFLHFLLFSVCSNIESDADCDSWYLQDFCSTNSLWMSAFCRKTCSNCDPTYIPGEGRPLNIAMFAPPVLSYEMTQQCWVWSNYKFSVYQSEIEISITSKAINK